MSGLSMAQDLVCQFPGSSFKCMEEISLLNPESTTVQPLRYFSPGGRIR